MMTNLRGVLLVGTVLVSCSALAAQTGGSRRTPAPAASPRAEPLPPLPPLPATQTALAPVEPAGPPETLGQAIADAYRSNPELEAQRAQLRALDEQVIQAAAPYRLTANLVGNFQYREQRARDFFDDFATTNVRTMGATITASQILLNGGRTAAQVSAAEAAVLSGREQLRETENSILFEVVDSYVAVRRDQEIVAIQQRSVDSYTRQVLQAEAREREGDLTRTDIAQARAQLEIVRAQLAQAQTSLQASRARFAAVVGRNPGVLTPEPALPNLPNSLDMAFTIAERESPAIWQAILNERSAASQVAAARAERAPVLSVNGSYGYVSPTTYQTRDLGRAITGAATVTVPLLAQGVIGSRIRAAVANRQASELFVEATRRNVNVVLQNAWNQSLAARDQLAAGEVAVLAAEQALTGVRRGFAEGFRSNFEVLDSEQRILNAQLVLANARYSRYSSQAQLLAVLGRLQAAAVDQAVPVYDETRNLRRVRGQQIGPFQTILGPIDRLQRSSGRTRPAPVIPPATDASVRPATVAPPEGQLGTRLPIDPSGRPPLPPSDAQPTRLVAPR